jgi:hypothetical protein
MRTRNLFLLLALGSLFSTAARPAFAQTVSFAFTGAEQTYTVPPRVNSIHVVAISAKGGKGSSDTFGFFQGGRGAVGERIEADLAVAPGEVLFVEVGGLGGDGSLGGIGIGGFNGGGTSTAAVPGGGGGGATDLRTCSAASIVCSGGVDSLDTRLLVAPGGGGGGAFGHRGQLDGGEGASAEFQGSSGETDGCASGETSGGGGFGGTLLAGGQGGTAGNNGGSPGQSGAFGVGGGVTGGALDPVAGGGGGGGYFGGGSGGSSHNCSGGGGGGGSTFVGATATNVDVHLISEPPGVVITAPDIAPPPEGPPGPPTKEKPSNAFSLGKVTRNRSTGTGTLVATLPGPGTLVLGGAGIVRQRKTVSAAGPARLPIKLMGIRRLALTRTGEATVRARIAFTPTGGDANTKVLKVKLVKVTKN